MAGRTGQEACTGWRAPKPVPVHGTRAGEGAVVAPRPRGPSSGLGQVPCLPGSSHPSSRARRPPLLTPQLPVLGLSPAGRCPPRGGAPRVPGTRRSPCAGLVRGLCPAGPASGLRAASPVPAGEAGASPSRHPPASAWPVQLLAGAGVWGSLRPPPHPVRSSLSLQRRAGWELGGAAAPQGAPLQRGAGAGAPLAALPALPAATAAALPLGPRVPHALRKQLLSGLRPRGLRPGRGSHPAPGLGGPCPPSPPSRCPQACGLACAPLRRAVWEAPRWPH